MTLKNQLKNVCNLNNLEEICDIFNKNLPIFLSKEEIKTTIDNHLFEWLQENKTSSKIFSKKAKIRLGKQKFHIHLKDLKTHIFFKISVFTKKGYHISWTSLHYVSTNKGLLYFQRTSTDEIFCFYAHFFDRLGERVFDETNRDLIIKEYIYSMMEENSVKIYNTINKDVQICKSDGIILGSFGLLKKGNSEEPTGRIIVYNTFLSTAMLKNNQKEMWIKAMAKKLKSEDPYIVVYER